MPAPLEATMFAIIPEHPEVGDMSVKVWPHISVMPWVQLGEWRHDALAEIEDIFQDTAPIALKPGRMMTVGGEGHEKAAQRIVSKELKELHMKLLYCLGSFGIVVSHPEWGGKNYRPHITSDTPRLLAPTAVNTLYVVDNEVFGGADRGTKVIGHRMEVGEREV